MRFVEKIRRSLRLKLVLSSALIIVMVLGLLLANTLRHMDSLVVTQAQLRTSVISTTLNQTLAEEVFKRNYDKVDAAINELLSNNKASFIYLVVFDEKGKLIAKAGAVDPQHMPTMNDVALKGGRDKKLDIVAPLTIEGLVVGRVHYGLSLSLILDARNRILTESLVLALLALALLVLALALTGKWLTRDLSAMVNQVKAVAAGRYGDEIQIKSEDELGLLAAAFNNMAGAIDSQMKSLKEQATLLDLAHDAIIVRNPDSSIRYWNHGAETTYGWSAQEVVGCVTHDLLKTRFPAPLPEITHMLGEAGNWEGELEHRRKDNSIIIVASRWVMIRDERGQPAGVMEINRDITERARSELERQRLVSIIENSSDLIGYADLDGRILHVNSAGRQLIGVSQNEDLRGASIFDVVLPEDKDVLEQSILPTVMARGLWQGEFRLRKFDGKSLPVEMIVMIIRDPLTGEPVGTANISRDITERKLAEKALSQHRERLEDAVRERTQQLHEAQRIARLGNWHWDIVTNTVTWSDETYRIFGYDPGKVQASYELYEARIHPDDLDMMQQYTQAILARQRTAGVDYRVLLEDGSQRWLHGEAAITLNSAARPVAMTGTLQDITERKQAEQELIEAKNAAERANRAKNEFLSRMSHELRTPMNAILGFSQVLEIEKLTAEQHDYVHEIHRAGDHLLELINELLDLSRIESGHMALTLQAVNMHALVFEALKFTQSMIDERQISVINQCDKHVQVLADQVRLRQILVNLLSNAAKYNRHGGQIRVECTVREDASLRLSVSDTGPGIAPEKQGQLFQPFERLGAENTGVDGTGIGLALCKQLAKLMGAELGVESMPGRGSTFWIDLPVAPREQETYREQPSPAIKATPEQKRILYIEDNAANLRVVEAMFRHQPNLQLLSATNGEMGLELARRYQPDMLLVDIHLPDMDGFTVLAALRTDPLTSQIPAVALSADAMPIDIERGLQAGFHKYLTKPVKIDDLMSALQSALSVKGASIANLPS